MDDVEAMLAVMREVSVPRWALTAAAMVVTALVVGVLSTGSRARRGGSSGDKGRPLPDDLRSVSVVGASYPLESFTGTVISDKTWIETSTTTTITTYGHTWSDTTRWYTPWASISVEQTHTKRDQLVLAYEDGTHGQWGFTNTDLAFAPGQTVTLIARPTKNDRYDCLVGYVHQTSRLDCFDFSAAHSIAGLRGWIAVSVLGAAGFVWGWMASMEAYLRRYAPDTPIPPITQDPFLWGVGLAVAAVVAIVPCALAGFVVPRARSFVFNRRYLPGIRRFCASLVAAPSLANR